MLAVVLLVYLAGFHKGSTNKNSRAILVIVLFKFPEKAEPKLSTRLCERVCASVVLYIDTYVVYWLR